MLLRPRIIRLIVAGILLNTTMLVGSVIRTREIALHLEGHLGGITTLSTPREPA